MLFCVFKGMHKFKTYLANYTLINIKSSGFSINICLTLGVNLKKFFYLQILNSESARLINKA